MRPSSARLLTALLCTLVVVVSFCPVGGAAFSLAQVSGTTWELLDSGYPDAVFRDVAFVDSMHGWIVGQKDGSTTSDLVVLYTDDGGDSWYLQHTYTPGWVTTIDVVDEQTAWINGNDFLFYTLDGGLTWGKSLGGGSSTVEFLNKTHGWTANNGVIYWTTDGGESWHPVEGRDFGDDRPRRMVALSPLEIWACGYFGTYHSVDGGESWTKRSIGGGWAMSFVSEDEAWIVDDNRLAHMTDGEDWVELTVPGGLPWLRLRGPYLTDIQFVDKANGWIAGQETPVMYTPDGGANWYGQSVPATVEETDPRIYAIHCIDQTHGWAVGSLGTVMRSTSANSVGVRLWGGSDDPIILSVIAAIAVGIVTGGVVIVRRRRRRTAAATPDAAQVQKDQCSFGGRRRCSA